MKMIDLHSHCLPNVDDGAKTVSESLCMLSESFKQGVELCAATPHLIIHRQKDMDEFLERRESAYKELTAAIEKDGNEFPEIILGGEVYLDHDINVYDGLEKVCYTGTDRLLLEFPMEKLNPRWAEWIYEMNRRGIKILVAHVDRYPEWEKMMAEFHGLEIEYQINASRFIKFSDRRLLKDLMSYDHRYIVSSDMHNLRGRRCNMAEGYEKAEKKYSKKSNALFYDNAKSLLKAAR